MSIPQAQNPSTARALFVGRFQPFHLGHEWLIRNKLDAGVPVLVAVRDIAPDEGNPLTAKESAELIRAAFAEEDAVVIVIPDIESINYGRGVGYQIIEHVPPASVAQISATEIRRQIRAGEDSWKRLVSPKIQDRVKDLLG